MQAKLTIRTVQHLPIQAKPYEVVDTELTGFLLRVQPSGVMTYYFAYRLLTGQKRRYRIGRQGALTVAQARDIALRLSAQVIKGEDVQATKQQAKVAAKQAKAHSLAGFLEESYAPWVEVEHKTGLATLKRIQRNFKVLLALPIEQLNTGLIEKWRYERLKAGKAATTVNRDIAALRSALTKAVDWGCVASHPLATLKPVKTDLNKKVRYLRAEEEERLRQALVQREQQLQASRTRANAWRAARGYALMPDLSQDTFADYLRPMVLLSLNTGLRRGELFGLRWEDVNVAQALLTVNGSRAKNGKTRHIPLNREALEVLLAWQKQVPCDKPDALVFSNRTGNRLDNVRKSWKRVLKAAAINAFRWHDMRHHFASRLVMAGVDLNTVRELLGHADVSMTLRYAHLAPEHKAQAVAKLVPAYQGLAA